MASTNVCLRFIKRYINLEQCIVLSRMDCDYKIASEIKKYLSLEETNYEKKNIDLLDHIPSSQFNNLSSYLGKIFINPLNYHFYNSNPYQTDIFYLQRLIDQQKLDKDFSITLPKFNESTEDYDPFIAHSNQSRYMMKDLSGNLITNLTDFYLNELKKIQTIKACYKLKYDFKELEHFLISYSNKEDHYLVISNHELVLNTEKSKYIIEK